MEVPLSGSPVCRKGERTSACQPASRPRNWPFRIPALRTEIVALRTPAGTARLDLAPEPRRMVGVQQVAELVHQHVLECGWARQHQRQVQRQAAIRCQRAPLRRSCAETRSVAARAAARAGTAAASGRHRRALRFVEIPQRALQRGIAGARWRREQQAAVRFDVEAGGAARGPTQRHASCHAGAAQSVTSRCRPALVCLRMRGQLCASQSRCSCRKRSPATRLARSGRVRRAPRSSTDSLTRRARGSRTRSTSMQRPSSSVNSTVSRCRRGAGRRGAGGRKQAEQGAHGCSLRCDAAACSGVRLAQLQRGFQHQEQAPEFAGHQREAGFEFGAHVFAFAGFQLIDRAIEQLELADHQVFAEHE